MYKKKNQMPITHDAPPNGASGDTPASDGYANDKGCVVSPADSSINVALAASYNCVAMAAPTLTAAPTWTPAAAPSDGSSYMSVAPT